MNYIELFAGCGGLSLGLKSVGFNLLMSNELSPMAAETYAYNLLGCDLSKAPTDDKESKKVLWISSKFTRKDIKNRLRENPFEYPNIENGCSDIINADPKILKGSIIVGDIIELNKTIKKNENFRKKINTAFENLEIDLISGGPPCQSFSMAGLRKKDCKKNSLPWEFIEFVETFQPKIVLLENVSGILKPFKDEGGSKYYAWIEIAKTFNKKNYITICLHVNAKFVGVPQNRPRFILIGIRVDIFEKVKPNLKKSEIIIFSKPEQIFKRINANIQTKTEEFEYIDIEKSNHASLYKESFLHPLILMEDNFISVKEAIDDLKKNSGHKSKYVTTTNEIFSEALKTKPEKIKNHDYRNNSDLVRRRFGIYQTISEMENSLAKEIMEIMKQKKESISEKCWEEIKKISFFTKEGESHVFNDKLEFIQFIQSHATKKQTQKALIAHLPAPAALSIPDDACHYDKSQQRTLTVREMARIQSFPDNFELRSKITTGGTQRQFEVPQYTQIGNAVPPLLGRALGLTIKNILSKAVN